MFAIDDNQADLFGYSDSEKEQLVTEQTRGLPPSIRKLIHVLGAAGAYHFLKKHGGTNLYVPCKTKSRSTLSDDMTDEQLEEFVKAFNPDLEVQKWISMPKTDKIMLLVRNRAIKEEKNNGSSLKMLAIKYELTSRQIQNIAKGE